ncbi:Phox homologous domain-containing protein, partial [Lactarius hatsudake]
MRPYSVASQAVSTIEEGSEAKFQQGGPEVVRGDAEGGSWYDAHDPMTGGLVPRDTFEASNEDAPSNPRNSQALSLSRPFRTPSTLTPLPSATLKTQGFYAVVLHDFVAKRPDELDAKAGDSILLVAQSNHEWFVGKPIGRLGRPGLIPVSFVEVRDPATGKPIPDVGALMDNGTLPRVEDWRKRMLSYRANSIALGVLEDPSPTPVAANTPPSPPMLPDGVLLSANMVSFHHEMDEYWFRLHALYQPFDPSGSSTLPPAKDLVLFRAYNDFFDFQIALLDAFPREGGREGKHPRVIPFIPGPSDHVDDSVLATRQTGLDDYLRRLCRLNRTTAHYILEHHLTREFFAPKPGDIENDTDPQYDRMAEVGWYDPLEDPEPVSINGLPSSVDDVVEK